MYGVHVRRTCTPYMYDSVNTALRSAQEAVNFSQHLTFIFELVSYFSIQPLLTILHRQQKHSLQI